MIPTSLRSGMLTYRSPFDPGRGFRLPAETDPVRIPSCETTIGTVVFLTHKKQQGRAILDVAGTVALLPSCRCSIGCSTPSTSRGVLQVGICPSGMPN